jgi:hypothetical protein
MTTTPTIRERDAKVTGESREQRGLALYRGRRGEFVRVSRDVVSVPSGSRRGLYYRVDLERQSCECRDFQRHHDTCKHLAAAEAYAAWVRKAASTIAHALDADEDL